MSEEKKKEMVELNDDQLDQVAGSGPGDSGSYLVWCPKCISTSLTRTGNKRPSKLGIIDDAEYICNECGNTFWGWI